jgi:hypothetical protein
MTFAFASFICLESALSERKKVGFIMVAGLLGGLSMATHLNGVVIAASGFLLLLWNRRLGYALLFGLMTLVAFSVYFYDFNAEHGINLWLFQFSQSPALDSVPDVPVLLQPFLNLLSEHQRFFHNPKIAVFSAFAIITLIAGIKIVFKKQPDLLRYAGLLFLMTALIAMHKSRQYILIYFPFLIMIITLTLKSMQNGEAIYTGFAKISQSGFRNTIFVLGAVFIAVSLYYNVILAIDKFDPEENKAISEKYADGKQSTMNIIAPMIFVFNEIEDYSRIQGEVCYVELQKSDSSIFGEGLFHEANGFDIDMIILTPYYQQKLGAWSTVVPPPYSFIDSTSQYIVFRRTE